jgi:hypothetical protein
MTATTEPSKLTIGPKRADKAIRMMMKTHGMSPRVERPEANTAKAKAAAALSKTPVVVRSAVKRNSFTELNLIFVDGFVVAWFRMSRIVGGTAKNRELLGCNNTEKTKFSQEIAQLSNSVAARSAS